MIFSPWITIPVLIISVVIHEVAHGYAALFLGDSTAKDSGRLSLNPLVHVDPFLTLLVPGILIASGSPLVFGGAKPVPVRTTYFLNPKRDMGIVAAAGPLSNFILAVLLLLFVQLYWMIFPHSSIITRYVCAFALSGVIINVLLGLFNLTPVPPLDGGRIVTMLLPGRLAHRYQRIEPFGFMIVIALLMTGYLSTTMQYVLSWLFEVASIPLDMLLLVDLIQLGGG